MATRSPRTADIEVKIPPVHDWRSTDQEEIQRRRARAVEEAPKIANLDPRFPIFSDFEVQSISGMTYVVEIRSLAKRQFGCDCVDFRTNGLGTCKHVEAVLLHVEARFRKLAARALADADSPRIDVVLDRAAGTLRVEPGQAALPAACRRLFREDGLLRSGTTPDAALALLNAADVPALRVSRKIGPWLASLRHVEDSKALRRAYELKVQSGEWPAQETLVPLFPYQREGMLHLAFTERALLADEMGLGKTIQAIAACALLHRLDRARRVLVITPASLKSEWEEQIQRFTKLPYQLVYGQRHVRLRAYENPPFFTIVNYEQMLTDSMAVNETLKPDVVVLDEAQRIKNWGTKTAQAVKRLRSRYAFVLTGTPIENRIDELYSIIGFLDPALFGPLFRFNRDYYELDDRGHPCGFKNLEQLHQRIKPIMIRRRKAEVETELPERTERTFFVPMSDGQQASYSGHEREVAGLVQIAKRRPLTKQQQDKLMRELAMMRMICDTNYILDPDDRVCPKLAELDKVLEECRDNEGSKVIVFSEWERMLELVRGRCEHLKLGYAWHTGSVPQKRRRAEINLFKSDPTCRVFLSTDSGSTGLNLQNADVVINCDLPWNPAKLEQRIARAWRKGQTRTVNVINLASENTIEHRMLGTLANKQALAEGVLDHKGDLGKIVFGGGRAAFLARLAQVLAPPPAATKPAPPPPPPLPVDRALAFKERALDALGTRLVHVEERFPCEGAHSVLLVVVDRDADAQREKLVSVHDGLFGPGKSDPLSPVLLEVLDRATYEALDRLAKAGLIATSTRATRHLPVAARGTTAPALTEEERRLIAEHRVKAARRLKMARLLVSGDLVEEARGPLEDAVLSVTRALAIESRCTPPRDLKEALLPPLLELWGRHAAAARAYCADPAANPAALLAALAEKSDG